MANVNIDLTEREREREAAYRGLRHPHVGWLQKESWQTAEDHGFHTVQVSVGDRIALIHSEASEALEAFRDGHDADEIWYENGDKPCGVPSEIADVVIRCLDFAEVYGFDLQAAILEKMEYNRSRPYLHGGKVL